MAVADLIQELRALETLLQDKNLPMTSILPTKYYSNFSPLIEEVLIDRNGRRNFDAIDALEEAGFDVFPLEKDSFGWLIGGIQTNCGIVVFG